MQWTSTPYEHCTLSPQPITPPLRHLDITSSFTTEIYDHDGPVYLRPMSRLVMNLTYEKFSIGRLRLNLYGTKPACHIYHADLDRHLQRHHFIPSEADPCLYVKRTANGTTLAAVTIDDLLVLAPSEAELAHFTNVLRAKYRVTNLGQSTVGAT